MQEITMNVCTFKNGYEMWEKVTEKFHNLGEAYSQFVILVLLNKDGILKKDITLNEYWSDGSLRQTSTKYDIN